MFRRFIISIAIVALLFPYSAFAAENTADDSVYSTLAVFSQTTQNIVYTSDQVGYVFFVDSDGECRYRKTSDAGTTWSSATLITDLTTCMAVGVWYDGWTPGDSGSVIHIALYQDNPDTYYYVSLNTSSDSLSSAADITDGFATGLSLGATTSKLSITKATEGTVYFASSRDATATDKYLIGCSSTCSTAGNWSEKDNPFNQASTAWYPVMFPIANGDLFIFAHNGSHNDIEYGTYDESADSFSGWTDLDTDANDAINQNIAIGGTIDHDTNDLYLTYINDQQGSSANGTMDIKTYIYDGASVTEKTDVLSNVASTFVTGVRLLRDTNNGDIYAVYVMGISSISHTDIYYKKSTDNMETWGSEVGPLNSQDDLSYGLSGNMLSDDRLAVSFITEDLQDMITLDIADLTPAEAVPEFSDLMYLFTFAIGFWIIYTYTQKPQQYVT